MRQKAFRITGFCTNATTVARSGSLSMQLRHGGATYSKTPLESLLKDAGVPYTRTGSHNQAEIASRFQVTVTPAPDFVVFDKGDSLKAMIECKAANDGGTARDKAARLLRQSIFQRQYHSRSEAVFGRSPWSKPTSALRCWKRAFGMQQFRPCDLATAGDGVGRGTVGARVGRLEIDARATHACRPGESANDCGDCRCQQVHDLSDSR